MIPPELRMAIFEVLDRSDPNGLRESEFVRGCLYQVAENFGQPVNDSLETYIELLVEEFCPDYVAGSR